MVSLTFAGSVLQLKRTSGSACTAAVAEHPVGRPINDQAMHTTQA